MQETASDVITLSSDDEFETPPTKKIKRNSDDSSNNLHNSSKILTTLNNTTTFTEKIEANVKEKIYKQEETVIIVSENEKVISTKKEYKTLINDPNVVVIDEEPQEEYPQKADEENINNISTITVDDPSEESEDPPETSKPIDSSVHQEALKTKEQKVIEVEDRPSTSTASEAHKLLDQFLETCASSVKGSKYESRLLTKFVKMKKHFNDCENLHNEVSLKRMLLDNIRTAQLSAADAVVCFQRTFSYLLDNLHGASIEIDERDLSKVKKLEKTCKKILKKLKELEEREINFEDENDSTYIQMDRYSAKLNEVYKKYCQLISRDPHAGRLSCNRMQFVHSKYDEVNRAITKSYKHNKFPSYYDLEKCVRSCVEKHNLPLKEPEIKIESEMCFTKLGNLLQLRRKKELYEIHCGYITLNEDPANQDPELKVKLQESLNEGEIRMKEVVEKYVKLQNDNVNPDVSDDSDDSNYETSGSDAKD